MASSKNTQSFNFDFLTEVLTQPTAPFREMLVKATLEKYFEENEIPYFEDKYGNFVVGFNSGKEYQSFLASSSKIPGYLFIAHMDHPGFHGESWLKEGMLKAKWFGGAPTQGLLGKKVGISNAKGFLGEGVIAESYLNAGKTTIDSLAIRTKVHGDAKTFFGSFHFRSAVWQENDLFFTKAADDLVGVSVVAQLAKTFAKKNKNFIGLLSRAEEVGFIGTIGHFKLGYLQKAKRPIICVSLETSRELPQAEVGKGPIVRLGDRATIFDPIACEYLTQLAREVLANRFQRRVMDGGTCEGTVAVANGLSTMGISIPLGNYHNQNFSQGLEKGPAPEFVHRQDIEGMFELCRQILSSPLKTENIWEERLTDFDSNLKKHKAYL